MSHAELAVSLCTGLAAVIVLLVAIVNGRAGFRGWPLIHTLAGLLGLLVWGAFLVAPAGTWLGGSGVGIVGLAFWWIVGVVGVVLLVAAFPRRARGVRTSADRGSTGSWWAVLGHLVVVATVAVMTWAYLVQRV